MFLSLLFIFIFLAGPIFLLIQSKYNYWKKLGLPQVGVKFPFGMIPKDRTLMHSSLDFYGKFKGKASCVGIYNIFQPMLMVIDPEMIKQILVKDFQYFQSSGMYHNEADDPLSANLFSVDNPKWRALRNKMSPSFTSGKIKMMFPTIVEIADRMKEVMDARIDQGETGIDMREMFARFTTDIIGSCAFGIDCNCLHTPNNEFRRAGMRIFQEPRNGLIKQFLMLTWPDLARKLHIKSFRDDVSDFFLNVVRQNVEYRLKNNIKRNDFVDLLIALRNEKKSNEFKDSHMDGLSMDEIAAQCMIFFLAGFETSSSASSFTIYELSKNQEIQDKLRNHIHEVLKKHDEQLTYEALKDMTYLDQCLNEGMRKYPVLPLLTRKSNENYKIPNTDVTIPKGTDIGFPVYAIHHDPQYFPNQEEYNPERFGREETTKRHPYCFLPFGEGPRNCIGERFGLAQTKIGLAYLIRNYRFKLNGKTKPISYFNRSLVLAPKDALYFDVEKVA